jgi:hypothetical protein
MTAAVGTVCGTYGWDIAPVSKREDGTAHIPGSYDFNQNRLINEYLEGRQ